MTKIGTARYLGMTRDEACRVWCKPDGCLLLGPWGSLRAQKRTPAACRRRGCRARGILQQLLHRKHAIEGAAVLALNRFPAALFAVDEGNGADDVQSGVA